MAIDLVKFCRLCAEISDIKINAFLDDDGKLSDMIFKYLSIKINAEDSLPIKVCEPCRQTVVSFEEFAMKCNNAQAVLESLLKHNNLLDEPFFKLEIAEEDEDVKQDIKNELLTPNDDSDFCDEDILLLSKSTSKKSKKRKSKETDPDYDIKPKTRSKQPDDAAESSQIKPRKYSKKKKDKTDGENVKSKRIKTDYSFFEYICHICSKKFHRLNTLKVHAKNCHSVSFKLLCVCGLYLRSRSSVLKHIRMHTTKTDARCKHCDTVFPSRRTLERHIEELSTDHYPFTCEQCPQKFVSAVKLRAHAKEKHTPHELKYIYQCELCTSKFKTKPQLKVHIDVDHNKIIPSVCDICGRTYRSVGLMNYHRRSHSIQETLPCPKCPKRLKSKALLKKHLDCHSNISYKCPKCPSILNTKQTLHIHMRVHENIYRYVCAFCNKAYKRKGELKCHMNRHTGARPYVCLWCPKTFVDNSNLRGHKKSMHAAELKEYEAIHGPPIGPVKKCDVSTEPKIIELIPNIKTPHSKIVLPNLNIEPVPSEYFPDLNPDNVFP